MEMRLEDYKPGALGGRKFGVSGDKFLNNGETRSGRLRREGLKGQVHWDRELERETLKQAEGTAY